MAELQKIEPRTLQFIEAHAKLKKDNKMVSHKDLAAIIGAESRSTITEILKKRQNIQPEQWKAFKKHFRIGTDISEHNKIEDPLEAVENGIQDFIEVKEADGKTIKVKPGNLSDMAVLNAFLKERDRVIDTIKEEKQARIDELKKDKEDLHKLLNSDLRDISKTTNLIFAMARTALQYHAHVASGGNDEREQELLDSLSLRIGDNLKVDVKQDNASSLNMSSK